jgi:hypothetical protein
VLRGQEDRSDKGERPADAPGTGMDKLMNTDEMKDAQEFKQNFGRSPNSQVYCSCAMLCLKRNDSVLELCDPVREKCKRGRFEKSDLLFALRTIALQTG